MRLFILFLFITSLISSCASTKPPKKIKNKNALRISYYNVDALYDTIPNQFLTDTAYLPSGRYQWNTEKYMSKLQNISKAIFALHDSLGADIVGLTGIENENVLQDLLAQTDLKQRNYEYAFLSCDSSYYGLGKAFLYNPKKIQILEQKRIPIKIKISPWNKQPPDAFGVKTYSKRGKDTFQFLVTDFDYNIPAIGVSTEKRYGISFYALKNILQNLNQNENNRTILMGTFFKEPDNLFFTGIIGSANPNNYRAFLSSQYANLHQTLPDSILKATFYQDTVPKAFDHIHLDRKYITQNMGWKYLSQSYHIFNPDWLRMPYQDYENQPFSVFYKTTWIRGYSQHFPVSFMIYYAKKRKYQREIY